ncbi:AsmA family protein [Herbaspirillum sp. RV1423]|uniref:AsmA family protein n=1 Tax=Herbaspirillum sp. RV1423 TaxID=1443993 RepID=UPI0004B2A8E4|nr:AsmA family protein [Herbaspirillum sp. RV1423]
MPRTSKIIGLSVAGVLTLLVLFIVLIVTFDWNRARPWINQRVSDATGRHFAIQGDLIVTWRKPDAPQTSWARWIPWPHVSAADIVLGNPDWAPADTSMAAIRQLDITLNPWPLLQHKIVLSDLEADRPQLVLLRSKDAANNWTFKSGGPSDWEFRPEKIVIRKGSIQLDDAIQKINARADIDTLDPANGTNYGIGWNVKGSFNKADINGEGKAGGVLSLQDESRPYPLEANVRVGKMHIAVKGTLTKPQDLAALDLQLTLSGDSMAHLLPLIGVVLPETPPFSTSGHLIGKLDRNRSNWIYDKFKGQVGSSDIGGTLEYQSQQPRPLLKGEVVSNLLRFEDLGPLIGADSNASKERRGAEERQPSGKVLPVKEFDTASWGSIDADVRLTAHRVVKEKDLPITDIQADLHLKDKVLSLTPLNFGMAGGNLASTIHLDGREPKMKSELKLSARHIRIQQLFPRLAATQTSFGEINGDAALSATGNSVAAMLASSNGELKTVINHGAISKLLLEEMGLNIGNVVVSKLFGDKQVRLNCMAGDFTVASGLMQARTFTLDTEDALINITGNVNLAQEQLDLTINPRSKGLRIISLRSPLYVTGPFNNPDIGVDKGILALKAGGAVLLGVIAPVAAILPLINMSGEQQTDCANLLQEVQQKPTAPPPGKTRPRATGK